MRAVLSWDRYFVLRAAKIGPMRVIMNWNVNERVAGDEGTLHIPSAIRIKLSIGGRLHYISKLGDALTRLKRAFKTSKSLKMALRRFK